MQILTPDGTSIRVQTLAGHRDRGDSVSRAASAVAARRQYIELFKGSGISGLALAGGSWPMPADRRTPSRRCPDNASPGHQDAWQQQLQDQGKE